MAKDDRRRGVGQEEVQSSPVSRILLAALAGVLATIPLGRRLPVGSSHLPAASPSRIIGRLFGVAPRRDCPFHPTRRRLVGHGAFAPAPGTKESLAAPFFNETLARARARRRPSTRLCCSDPHLTVGRRYLLRRSAESGLSSASLERRRGCPANFAPWILGCAPGFQARPHQPSTDFRDNARRRERARPRTEPDRRRGLGTRLRTAARNADARRPAAARRSCRGRSGHARGVRRGPDRRGDHRSQPAALRLVRFHQGREERRLGHPGHRALRRNVGRTRRRDIARGRRRLRAEDPDVPDRRGAAEQPARSGGAARVAVHRGGARRKRGQAPRADAAPGAREGRRAARDRAGDPRRHRRRADRAEVRGGTAEP